MEIDGGQDHEQSATSLSEYEGTLEDDGDVNFGTQTAASSVADEVAELSLHADIASLEENSDCDDESSKCSEDGTQQ